MNQKKKVLLFILLTVRWRNVELAMRKILFFDKSNSCRLSWPRKLFSVMFVILFFDRSASDSNVVDFFISLLMCRWHFVNVERKKQQLVQQFFVKNKIGKWVKYHYYGIYIVCCMSATCTFLVA